MQIIRSVNKSDLNKCREVKPEIDEETFNRRIRMEEEGKVRFLILEIDDKPVCIELLKWGEKPSHPEYPDLEDLYTKQTERGKGYGSVMLKECERLSKEKGFNKIGLAVNPDENDNAHKLYLKFGYRDLNEPKYLDGVYNGVEDWVIDMEKDI